MKFSYFTIIQKHIRNFKPSINLRKKFILSFLLLVLIPFLALGFEIYSQSKSIIEENLYMYVTKSMKQTIKSIEYYLNEMDYISQIANTDDTFLKSLGSYNKQNDYEKLQAARKINNFLMNISAQRSDIEGIYLFDFNFNFFYAKGMSPKQDYDYFKEEWFKDSVLNDGRMNIVGTHVQRQEDSTPSYVISVSRQIKDYITQKPLGVLLIDINYKVFDKIIDRDISETSSLDELYILDSNGIILYNNDSKLLTKKADFSFLDKISSQDHGISVEKVNGRDMFVVFNTSPVTSWKIINMSPTNKVFKDVILIRNSIIVTVFLFIIFILLLSFQISRKLVKPINSLVKAMSEVETGNFSIAVEISSRDEIKILADSFNKMSRNMKNLIEKVYISQLHEKEAELIALQSQINPHFLYNTLDAIRGLAILGNVQRIEDMVKGLSDLFRYSIYKGKKIVTIKDEVEHIKNYIMLQNFRHENKFIVDFDSDESLLDYDILKLIIQPLVENSIVHGLETKIGSGRLGIFIEKADENILITITDDGIGIPEKELNQINYALESEQNSYYLLTSTQNRSSIGISNVNSRIKLYFGSGYGLKFESKYGIGTTVKVLIPARKERIDL